MTEYLQCKCGNSLMCVRCGWQSEPAPAAPDSAVRPDVVGVIIQIELLKTAIREGDPRGELDIRCKDILLDLQKIADAANALTPADAGTERK